MRYDPERLAEAPVGEWEQLTPYELWLRDQPVPVHAGTHIDDLNELETSFWDLFGVSGALVDLVGASNSNGSYVLRLEVGQETLQRRQAYDEIVYVARGQGITEVQVPSGSVATARWSQGSLISLPINRPYRHIAADEEALLYCVNSSPMVLNLFHDAGFVWANDYEFEERPPVTEGYFDGEGELYRRPQGGGVWETSFVEDVVNMPLTDLSVRGAGGTNISFELGDSPLIGHVSQFPVGRYKKAHRHGPGAHIVILGGSGYSLLWRDDFESRVRVDWRKDCVFVPPGQWWHQHFNTGAQPARYLAIRWGSRRYPIDHSYDGVMTDRRAGGDQIEYDDEDPAVYEEFVVSCREQGTKVQQSKGS